MWSGTRVRVAGRHGAGEMTGTELRTAWIGRVGSMVQRGEAYCGLRLGVGRWEAAVPLPAARCWEMEGCSGITVTGEGGSQTGKQE